MHFKVTFITKWSDFDPNKHMRHTAYNEYAAEVRIRYFRDQNFSIEEFTEIFNGKNKSFRDYKNNYFWITLGARVANFLGIDNRSFR